MHLLTNLTCMQDVQLTVAPEWLQQLTNSTLAVLDQTSKGFKDVRRVSNSLKLQPTLQGQHEIITYSCILYYLHTLTYRVSHKRRPTAKILKVDIFYYLTFFIITK